MWSPGSAATSSPFCFPRPPPAAALTVARDIRALLGEHEVGPPLVASVGIATFDGTEELTAEEVLVCADIALYEAKQRGGDQPCVYAGPVRATTSRWVERIRGAIAEERFVLHGQPIVDLRSGAVIHHELVVRMVDLDGELVEPAAFLPTAERFGLIHEIDRWVTVQGLRLAREGQRVAINLSGQSLGQEPILEAVREAIAGGAAARDVLFAISETAAMTNIGAARSFTTALNSLGCSVALDEFGTGFGSFTYIKHMPARYLKIDIDFMRDLGASGGDRHLARSIVGIAHGLGKLTIASGVDGARAGWRSSRRSAWTSRRGITSVHRSALSEPSAAGRAGVARVGGCSRRARLRARLTWMGAVALPPLARACAAARPP